MRKSILLASVGLSVAAFSVPATAQDATAVAQTAEVDEADSGEIIVTATRRATALSNVPIAVSAVTADQLQNSGAADIRQLGQLTPSLLVSSATNESNGAARIRGIGTVGENPGLESSVAVFIDGVYRSRTGVGLGELGAVERIEVLRGPQGTLFGRNASAGLINIVTRKPSFDLGGEAEASYGNYDYYRIGAGVTGPILGDKVAGRLDAVYVKRDGFLTDATSGRSLNDRDRYIVRAQILAEPTDDLTFRIVGDYSQKSEECCGAVYLNPVRNLTRGATGPVSSANTLVPILTAFGANLQLPSAGDTYIRRTSITPGFDYHQDSSDKGLSGEISYKYGDVNMTSITAYREYKSENGQDSDFNAADILRRTDQDRTFKTFTQEVRFQGTTFSDRLDWLVGGYYAHERLFVDDDIKYGNDYERFANCVLADNFARALGQPTLVNTADSSCFNRPLAGALAANVAIPAATRGQVAGLAGLAPFSAAGFNPLGGFANIAAGIGFAPPAGTNLLNGTGVVNNTFNQTSRNYAFFTHNVIQIFPDVVTLTLGARYTNERKTLTGSFNTNNNFCAALRATALAGLAGLPCVINNSSGAGILATDPDRIKGESEGSGTAVLSIKPFERLLTYFSYSKGYKAGGFNLDTSALDTPSAAVAAATGIRLPANGRPEAADLRFEPERVDAFEFGAKLNLRDFKLNAALFYQRFKNFQLNTFNGVNFEVTNIQACRDSLGGTDRDGIAGNSSCATNRLKPGVVSKGVELEAQLFPAPFLSFSLGGTYTDTGYANNLTGTAGRSLAPTLFQLPGQQLSNASKYTTTAAASYQPPIANDMSGLVYVDMRYQSAINTGSDLDAEKVQQGFTVVNARLGLYGKDKRWGLELWSQNLFNEKYQQVAADAPLQGGGTFNTAAATAASGLAGSVNQLFITFPAEPRTFGVTVRTKF